MSTRRSHRRFQPVVAELPLRIAPAVFGAMAATPIERTTAPDLETDTTPPPRFDLLCTTAPDSSV